MQWQARVIKTPHMDGKGPYVSSTTGKYIHIQSRVPANGRIHFVAFLFLVAPLLGIEIQPRPVVSSNQEPKWKINPKWLQLRMVPGTLYKVLIIMY
jgi:hypothetical protein